MDDANGAVSKAESVRKFRILAIDFTHVDTVFCAVGAVGHRATPRATPGCSPPSVG